MNEDIYNMEEETTVSTDDLGLQLAHVLADNVVAKFLAHGYHWNVMGPDFKEYHSFFADIYGSFDDAIDPLAEYLLINSYEAPYLLADFVELSCINEERIEGGDAEAMLVSLLKINEMLKIEATKLFDIADALDAQDIANYAAELINTYGKWVWQLKATLGNR